MDHDDPYTHLSTFYELVGTMDFQSGVIEFVYILQSSKSRIQPIRRNFCRGGHPNGNYSYQNNSSEAKISYMGNQGRQGGFSNNNNYSQGWRSNQNQSFRWKQDSGPSNKQGPFQQQQPLYHLALERLNKIEDTLEKFVKDTLASQENNMTTIKNLETQVE